MRAILSRPRMGIAFNALGRAFVVAVLCGQYAPAQAAGVVGTGTPASCTSAALASAIASGTGNITFACGAAPVTIVIATPGGLVVPSGVYIDMDGANKIELSGGLASRVFVVAAGGTLRLNNLSVVKGFSASDDGGAIRNDGRLFIDGCTFADNLTTPSFSGGAILTYGELNISNSEFRNNQAGNGGAIYPRFAAAQTIIFDTTFDLNFTTSTINGWGGAILVWDGALVTLIRTIFHDNTARQYGGAILVEGASILGINASQFYSNAAQAVSAQGGAIYTQGTLVIIDSTFHSNHANGNGGVIFMNAGSTDIRRSTFNANWAGSGGAYQQEAGILTAGESWFYGNGYNPSGTPVTSYGGAFDISGGAATLTNLTVSGNYADFGGGLFLNSASAMQNMTLSGNHARYGAGLYRFSGDMTLTNVTVYQNSATNGTGGVHQTAGAAGAAVIHNTIVANNTGADANGSNVRSLNCDAPFDFFAFNLSSDGSCAFGAGRDNVIIQLMALANAGGYAPTHVPLPTSPAIDNASNLYCPTDDQRGFLRAGKGSACDVGSVEYDPTALVLQSVKSRKTHGAAGTFDLTLSP